MKRRTILIAFVALALLTPACEPLAEVIEEAAEKTVEEEEVMEDEELLEQKEDAEEPLATTRPPGEAPSATAPPSEAIEGQMLLRDFALPIPLFASDSAWNQIAANVSVLPESDQQILVLYRVLLGDDSTLSPKLGYRISPFMYVSYDEWTIPVFRMSGTEQTVLLCNYDGDLDYTNPKLPEAYLDPGGPVTIPAPVGTVRPSAPEDTDADGHLVLYNPDVYMEYDFWQATTVRDGECRSRGGGQPGTSILEAGMIDFFDVRGTGANPLGYFSARASGVPLLAGLILPEDIEAGAIEHALAVAIPRPRNTNQAAPWEPHASDIVYPASQAEWDFFNTDPDALAQGQRIRLKESIIVVDEAWGDAYGVKKEIPIDDLPFAPITLIFLKALHTYGAYVVDNSDGLVFYAEDIHTANLRLSDDEVNALIGEPPGTPLPEDKTKWQIVIEKLNEDLTHIPLASGGSGPWWEYGPGGKDPALARIDISNLEVVEPATEPSGSGQE